METFGGKPMRAAPATTDRRTDDHAVRGEPEPPRRELLPAAGSHSSASRWLKLSSHLRMCVWTCWADPLAPPPWPAPVRLESRRRHGTARHRRYPVRPGRPGRGTLRHADRQAIVGGRVVELAGAHAAVPAVCPQAVLRRPSRVGWASLHVRNSPILAFPGPYSRARPGVVSGGGGGHSQPVAGRYTWIRSSRLNLDAEEAIGCGCYGHPAGVDEVAKAVHQGDWRHAELSGEIVDRSGHHTVAGDGLEDLCLNRKQNRRRCFGCPALHAALPTRDSARSSSGRTAVTSIWNIRYFRACVYMIRPIRHRPGTVQQRSLSVRPQPCSASRSTRCAAGSPPAR